MLGMRTLRGLSFGRSARNASGAVRLVTIAAVYSRSELYALLCLLRTNGVSASTIGEGHAGAEWITVALGGVRVAVPEEQLSVARELLAGIDQRPPRTPLNLVEAALFAMMAFFLAVPPPARIPAEIFITERREA
jgi:hypothetical protein